jgi:hypothetical protein
MMKILTPAKRALHYKKAKVIIALAVTFANFWLLVARTLSNSRLLPRTRTMAFTAPIKNRNYQRPTRARLALLPAFLRATGAKPQTLGAPTGGGAVRPGFR